MNIEQKIAAEHNDGPLLLLAGPGTGKTTTLVARYQFLITQKVNAKQIICCTFSKKAADELKLRISEKLDIGTKGLPIATFHALSLRILKAIGEPINVPNNFEIWAKNFEREKIIRELLKQNELAKFYDKVELEDQDPKKILEYIDTIREELLDPEDASVRAAELNDRTKIAHCEVYAAYEEYLNTENKIDYPRMAQLACKALSKDAETGGHYVRRFQHILVDEFQDINLAQKTLVDAFFKAGVQLWAVGDDYQAIYGWRGSKVKYMLEFEKEYVGAKIQLLKQNYRSGNNILKLANNLSQHFLEAYKKELNPTRDTDGKVFLDQVWDEDEEADAIVDEITLRIDEGVPLSEIAVISRTNSRPKKVASELIRRGIPIQIRGAQAPFEEFEVKQLVSAAAIASGVYLKLSWPRIPPALYSFAKTIESDPWQKKVRALSTYIANRPPKGVSSDELKKRQECIEKHRDVLLESADAKKFFAIMEASFANDGNSEKVFVGTVHSAKGLEWDSVFFMGLEDGNLPQRQSMAPQVYDEERRIAYVGITRAKNFLFLTTTTKQQGQENEPSPFLKEMFGPENTSRKQSKDQTKSKPMQSDTQKNPILDRIQNLKQKAVDPASSKSEAEAAEAMAKKLMDKHSVTIKNGHLTINIDKKFDLNQNSPRSRSQFWQQSVSDEENTAWIKARWQAYQDRIVERLRTASELDTKSGGNEKGWDDGSASSGFLQEAGYTVRKDGPSTAQRQQILADVLQGKIKLPDWLSDTVQLQWGAPNSDERLKKIRNTLAVALGTQLGRANPSEQAVRKWKADMEFLDNEFG